MSNYIHHTNQTLLWNTVNKIPEFQKLSPPKKDFEFKQVIEFFYRTVSNKQILSVYELQKINRDTILAFIPQQIKIQPPPEVPREPREFSGFQKIPTQSQFEERQNIYKQMTTKPELPSPEIFKDKEDTAIENMDVLINQYQKQREIEFNQYIPPAPIQPIQKNPHIRILEDISETEKEKIGIEIGEEKNKNKKVSFSPNNQEYISTSTDDYWEKKISKLEERIFLLEEKMLENEIKQQVSLSLEKIINHVQI